MRKGPDGPLECLGGRGYAGLAIGWALALPIVRWVGYTGYWEGGSTRYSTRYSTLPVPPPYPSVVQCRMSRLAVVPLGHAHMTSLDSPKEILGVDNAQYPARYRSTSRTPHLTHAPRSPGPALGACCEAAGGARMPSSSAYLSISQNISVFLSISQNISVFQNISVSLSISQYLSLRSSTGARGRTALRSSCSIMRRCTQ